VLLAEVCHFASGNCQGGNCRQLPSGFGKSWQNKVSDWCWNNIYYVHSESYVPANGWVWGPRFQHWHRRAPCPHSQKFLTFGKVNKSKCWYLVVWLELQWKWNESSCGTSHQRSWQWHLTDPVIDIDYPNSEDSARALDGILYAQKELDQMDNGLVPRGFMDEVTGLEKSSSRHDKLHQLVDAFQGVFRSDFVTTN